MLAFETFKTFKSNNCSKLKIRWFSRRLAKRDGQKEQFFKHDTNVISNSSCVLCSGKILRHCYTPPTKPSRKFNLQQKQKRRCSKNYNLQDLRTNEEHQKTLRCSFSAILTHTISRCSSSWMERSEKICEGRIWKIGFFQHLFSEAESRND